MNVALSALSGLALCAGGGSKRCLRESHISWAKAGAVMSRDEELWTNPVGGVLRVFDERDQAWHRCLLPQPIIDTILREHELTQTANSESQSNWTKDQWRQLANLAKATKEVVEVRIAELEEELSGTGFSIDRLTIQLQEAKARIAELESELVLARDAADEALDGFEWSSISE